MTSGASLNNWYKFMHAVFFFMKKLENLSPGSPKPQTHPRSSPGHPTQPHGSLEQSGRGNGTAGSLARDRRSFSVSCRSAALARSGRGASHIAETAEEVNC